ncbi:hypothetical protein [Methanoregula sp.]|uniref:hypothetical protein n=1 Tax=Methanoregula sp. TaxID=2052170 RepID=UPI003C368F2D
MTITGKLDFEGDVARIDDKNYKMLSAAARWCAERLKKGMIVDAELIPDGDKKGWISKIYEHKGEIRQESSGKIDEKNQHPNERLPVFLTFHRNALQGAQTTTTPDSQDYDAFMDMVYTRAKEDTDRAFRDFGGA